MKTMPTSIRAPRDHFRRYVQGESRHNSLRSARASLGTYCVFALHCALEMKGRH